MRILLYLLLMLATNPAFADSADAAPRSLREAVEQVQAETDGKILSAEQVRVGRNKVYRIKVLTPDGKVRVVQLQAAAK